MQTPATNEEEVTFVVDPSMLYLEKGSTFVYGPASGVVKHDYPILDICLALSRRSTAEEGMLLFYTWHQVMVNNSPPESRKMKEDCYEGLYGYLCGLMLKNHPKLDETETYEVLLKASDVAFLPEEIPDVLELYMQIDSASGFPQDSVSSVTDDYSPSETV